MPTRSKLQELQDEFIELLTARPQQLHFAHLERVREALGLDPLTFARELGSAEQYYIGLAGRSYPPSRAIKFQTLGLLTLILHQPEPQGAEVLAFRPPLLPQLHLPTAGPVVRLGSKRAVLIAAAIDILLLRPGVPLGPKQILDRLDARGERIYPDAPKRVARFGHELWMEAHRKGGLLRTVGRGRYVLTSPQERRQECQ